MARPTKMTPEKIKLLEQLCRMKPTIKDCAEILDVDQSTIEKWIYRTHDQSFSEFRDQKMAHTRFMIIRNIIRECEKGNVTMLIYASKNLCGWSDKHEQNDPDKQQSININIVKDGN
jgi:hypothetical protein